MSGEDRNSIGGAGRRGIVSALLVCWLVLQAAIPAASSGSDTLNNGAVLSWDVGDEPGTPRLAVLSPTFAMWSREGFAEEIVFRLSSNYLAFVDRWKLDVYRAGDTRLESPIRTFEGGPLSLHTPIRWDGKVDSGPALRPGETVQAILSVRDAAGNIDSTVPQDTLIARYKMRRESRRLAAETASRERSFEVGQPFGNRDIAVAGFPVRFRLSQWSEESEPMISGLRLTGQGETWQASQILPGGWFDVVVQTTRKIIGGIRAIPVGTAVVGVPTESRLLAGVKGTGTLERLAGAAYTDLPDGLMDDGAVRGSDAIGLILMNASGAESRAALAKIDARADVQLLQDERKRRSLHVVANAGQAQWAGNGGRTSPASAPYRLSTIERMALYPLDSHAEIFLPEPDVRPDSVRVTLAISPTLRTELLGPDHFLLNAREGRVRLMPEGKHILTEAMALPADQRPGAGISVRYSVTEFGLAKGRQQDEPVRMIGNGTARFATNLLEPETESAGQVPVIRRKGVIARFMEWATGS